MTKNHRIIVIALVNSFMAFLCGVSFGPWLPWLTVREAPGNLLVVFILLIGLSVLVMVVRGDEA
jgi:hypothetical protein